MLTRSRASQEMPLNIVGSNTFGRYSDISDEQTWNMFISDNWLVPYAGYETAIDSTEFTAGRGRGFLASANYDRLVVVIGTGVYLVQIDFNQEKQKVTSHSITNIGHLDTDQGIVYIAENNKPQILFSDNHALYIYDTTLSSTIQVVSGIDFIPGYIDFHDTHFLCAQQGTSNWRISNPNEGSASTDWPFDSQHVGALQTKPDQVQAVVRFPSRGNMILVMGKSVTETWFDTGASLFPYQRQNSYNMDYGCANPETIATMDQLVVWLAINEKSGPVIMYSTGLTPKPITTDGIDYLMSNMQNPEDSQAFIFRQDGHILYHINFYTDNISLVYDFKTAKFFYASDENENYFIASSVAFYRNQYYFISPQNSKIYAFDTIFTTYDGKEIPRIRVCKNIRFPQQDYFVVTDLGFTIESGSTNYIYENQGPKYLISEDEILYITEGGPIYLANESGELYVTEDGNYIISEQASTDTAFLITENDCMVPVTPRIDLSISINGGESYSSYESNSLPSIGQRKNKLMWWQGGATNDLVCQFRFYGIGRFVCTNGVVNVRR